MSTEENSNSPVGISVVLTCYNLEAFITQALESVVTQDCPVPFEIIAVDDCSQDLSADLIKRFATVRYLRTLENAGVLNAMMTGIEAAKYDLVSFMDGDDIWEEGKLSATWQAFQNPDVALFTHDIRYIGRNGEFLPVGSRVERMLGPLPASARGEAVRSGILSLSDYVWLGSAFAVRKSRGRVDEFIRFARQLPDPKNTYQDWPLAYWIAALPDARMAFDAAPLARYRLHGANSSGDASTAQKALRNFNRARNTVSSMQAIAQLRQVDPEHQASVIQELKVNDYYLALYSKRRMAATRLFLSLILVFKARLALGKELVRFFGIQVVGPWFFARLKALDQLSVERRA